jgi:hypothetical protein
MVAQKQLYVYPSILKNYGGAIFARKTWTFQHNIYARIEHLKTYTQLGTSNIPRFCSLKVMTYFQFNIAHSPKWISPHSSEGQKEVQKHFFFIGETREMQNIRSTLLRVHRLLSKMYFGFANYKLVFSNKWHNQFSHVGEKTCGNFNFQHHII